MKRSKITDLTPRSNILDFLHTADEFFTAPDLSDLMYFDFTQEHPHSKAHTSDVLPLPRGGDFLQRYDLINAPILGDNQEVDYWVTGVIETWGYGMVTIVDNNDVRHYATMESVEEVAELIAAAITSEGYAKFEQELYEYASKIVA